MDCLDFFSMTHDIEIENEINNIEIQNLFTNYRKTAIYTSHKNAIVLKNDFINTPKLITLTKRINKNHHSSALGEYILTKIGYEKRTPQDFIDQFNGKYVAELARIFIISCNHIDIWNKYCTNGVFNIWNPAAPYNRLNIKDHQVIPFDYNPNIRVYDVDNKIYRNKNQLPDAKILLLRIIKLNSEDVFDKNQILIKDHYDQIKQPRKVSLDNPVVDDFNFNGIYSDIIDYLEELKMSIPFFRYHEDDSTTKYLLKYIDRKTRNKS